MIAAAPIQGAITFQSGPEVPSSDPGFCSDAGSIMSRLYTVSAHGSAAFRKLKGTQPIEPKIV